MVHIAKEDLTEFLKTHTNQQAAEHFGISPRTLSRRLAEFGLIRPGWGAGKLDVAQAEQIRRDYEAGLKTQKELSIEYSVTPKTIWRIVNEMAYRIEVNFHLGGYAGVEVNF